MFKAVITTVVMALSEKQKNCSSDKTTTVCGDSSESLQLPTKPHSRGCESTYNKVLFTPPTMCRLTVYAIILLTSYFAVADSVKTAAASKALV